VGVTNKQVPKTVVLEQAWSLEPAPRSLNTHEKVRCIAKSVECLKFKHVNPNDSEHSEPESHEIPPTPVRLSGHLSRKQLSPAKPHRAKVWFLKPFSSVMMPKSR